MQKIHISNVNGKSSVCFDTGLDPRSFARTKMSQSLIEPGYIVSPDKVSSSKNTHTVWKAIGVTEMDGLMRVWGPSFSGERLDLIINEVFNPKQDADSRAKARQAALEAIVYWIRAKMLLGETQSALSPGSAFVTRHDQAQDQTGTSENFSKGSVFFTPENLSQRCLFVEGAEPNYYYCPDLNGMEAAAFCAGAMLYRLFTNTHPYPDENTVFQDMREGVFLPVNVAAPGLDEKINNLIQAALLLPVNLKKLQRNLEKDIKDPKDLIKSGTDILGSLLNILMDKDGNVVSIFSIFQQLNADKKNELEKERNSFNIRKKIFVSTKRFIVRNKHAVIISSLALSFVLFIIFSITMSYSDRPTTEGLYPDAVVITYYEAFNSLNHVLMEACIMGADKTDIDAAIGLFVIDRVRMSHEIITGGTSLISARVWRHQGGELPALDVFGTTDLNIWHVGGSERDGTVMYRADYTIWFPTDYLYSVRNDELTLKRDRRRNWRIVEINRTEIK
jgi:hypothetical protein